jgi:hypothetical protein
MEFEGWDNELKDFILLSTKHEVKMLMVGGGAVNFHGYQRHSSDVDFWIDLSESNLNRLIQVFQEMGYDINDFPSSVKNAEQNISLKFSPTSLNIELITSFNINKEFGVAFQESIPVQIGENKLFKWNVISYDDLITSKIKAARPKDLLDIQELERRKNDSFKNL